MAKLVKKTKKGLGGLRSASAGSSSVESSPLRPVHVPKTPPCQNKCPSGNKIREILCTISQSEGAERSYHESYEKHGTYFQKQVRFLQYAAEFVRIHVNLIVTGNIKMVQYPLIMLKDFLVIMRLSMILNIKN